MTPYFSDASLTVYQGDCREVLATLPAGSVHCVVTSPPYWGLRDYGTEGQLGLEPSPDAYIAAMVDVFREVRRVLRDDGTVWCNMGDGYWNGGGEKRDGGHDFVDGGKPKLAAARGALLQAPSTTELPLKPKDLIGMPWRLAFALQADGWYLRSEIIWAKPNPMPESVTDRPTKSHEYLFLLSKKPRYYYDAEAVREAAEYGRREWSSVDGNLAGIGIAGTRGSATVRGSDPSAGRNLRSVWTIATQPYPGAHFATFPEKLVEPCIKAGTSERGVCPECGAPWLRESVASYDAQGRTTNGPRSTERRHESPGREVRMVKSVETTGWRAGCPHLRPMNPDWHVSTCRFADGGSLYPDPLCGECTEREVAEPVPATVLDPFGGSGTTAMVANRLGRRAILIDLSTDYLEQAMGRNAQAPLELGA